MNSTGERQVRLVSSFGAFGVYLAPHPPLPRPAKFTVRIQTAFRLGFEFGARKYPHGVTYDVPQIGKKLLEEKGFTIWDTPQANAWDNVYTAAFWYAASVASVPENRPAYDDEQHLPARFGARSQRDLTRALLSLTEADRYRISWLLQDSRNDLRGRWIGNFKGAMTVARVAACAQRLGFRPVAPLIYIDMLGIDLLVEKPGPEPSYLCLQMKSRTLAETSCCLLTESLVQDLPATDCWKRAFQAMERFRTEHQLTCVPGAIEIGNSYGKSPFDLEPPPEFLHSFQQLLSHLP